MAETSIQWADYTFNPWSGCTKVSPGCANCYAEVNYSVKVRGVKWGPQSNRIVASESMWKQPLMWDRLARDGICITCRGRGSVLVDRTRLVDGQPEHVQKEKACERCGGLGNIGPYRARVFCASLADIFEDWTGPMLNAKGEQLYCDSTVTNKAPWTSKPFKCHRPLTMQDVRNRLFRLIDATPHIDWLVLTKRPENIGRMMPEMAVPFGDNYRISGPKGSLKLEVIRKNLWLGTSIENRATRERIDELRTIPAAIRFLSIEPLLEEIGTLDLIGIDLVIVGGESGPKARPCNVDWIRSIVRQCKAAGVACFVKQLGSIPILPVGDEGADWPDGTRFGNRTGDQKYNGRQILLNDSKGGDMSEWPNDLRVREMPKLEGNA